MQLPDPPVTPPTGATRWLPIARLLLALTPSSLSDHGDVVELDRQRLHIAATQSTALAHAGWTIALNIEGPRVDLVALKRTVSIEAAVTELAAIGVKSGGLYLDSPDLSSTIHSVELNDTDNAIAIDPPERRTPTTSDLDLQLRLGALVAQYVPHGTDGERLLNALQDSTLPVVIADAAFAITDTDTAEDGRQRTAPAPAGTGEDVTVELPDHEPMELPGLEAAQRMVDAYGYAARGRPAAGQRAALDSYWCEVERLLECREEGQGG